MNVMHVRNPGNLRGREAPMGPEYIDFQSLTGLLNSLSALTDLAFTLYRHNGELLLTARTEDRLMTQLISYMAGKDEYKMFIRSGIHMAAERDDILVLKGPAHQHHLFIPLSLSSVLLVLVSNPFYLHQSEFERFILERGRRLSISLKDVGPWHTMIPLKEHAAVRKTAEQVRFIFETVLKNSHESAIQLLSLQHTYCECLADLERLSAAPEQITPSLSHPDALHERIISTAAELTKAERVSLMLPENDGLLIKAVKGEDTSLTQGMKIKMGEGVAGRVFKEGKPLIVTNTEMLRRLAIKPKKHYKTDSFISVPLTFEGERIGVLNVADKSTGEGFTPIDAHLLNYFASYAALALKVASCHILTEELRALSITDPLTGLFNRRYLEERFTEEIRRSERYHLSCSLILFDIDDFKLFNDTEGHLAGDEVLKEVAKGAQRSARVHDVFCRFGGEEFAIIMPQTSKEEAYLVAERIRKNVKSLPPMKVKKSPRAYVTISLGVAAFPEDGRTVEELINNADTALYQAKSLGKDKSCMYRPSTPAL